MSEVESGFRLPRIYVAGPMGNPPKMANTLIAIEVADKIMAMGAAPFVPHLSLYWHLIYPHTPEEWLAMDYEWVKVSDALFRIHGLSVGSDKEVAVAKNHGIPVFTDLEALKVWIDRETMLSAMSSD